MTEFVEAALPFVVGSVLVFVVALGVGVFLAVLPYDRRARRPL